MAGLPPSKDKVPPPPISLAAASTKIPVPCLGEERCRATVGLICFYGKERMMGAKLAPEKGEKEGGAAAFSGVRATTKRAGEQSKRHQTSVKLLSRACLTFFALCFASVQNAGRWKNASPSDKKKKRNAEAAAVQVQTAVISPPHGRIWICTPVRAPRGTHTTGFIFGLVRKKNDKGLTG